MSAFLRYIKSFSDYLLKERNYSVHTHESYVRDVTQYITFSAAQEENPEVPNAKSLRKWVRELSKNNISGGINHLNSSLSFLMKIPEPLNWWYENENWKDKSNSIITIKKNISDYTQYS